MVLRWLIGLKGCQASVALVRWKHPVVAPPWPTGPCRKPAFFFWLEPLHRLDEGPTVTLLQPATSSLSLNAEVLSLLTALAQQNTQ